MENYSSRKLELLALKWAVTEKLRSYLLGAKFKVYTDKNPLCHLRTAKLGATEQRWQGEIAAFDFDIVYRPGKHNANADTFSRYPAGNPEEEETDVKSINSLQWNRLRLYNGELVRIVYGPEGEIQQVVLPQLKCQEACRLAHDMSGHQGPERTLQTLRKRFFWVGMHHDVFDYCRRCHRCQVAKAPAQTIFRAPAHITANYPLEMIAVDFTQMEMSSDGRDTVLVITDVFSKWAMAVPVRDQTAKTVVKVLIEEGFTVFGATARIHSDQGRAFEAEVVRELCDHYGIEKSRTDLYNPRSKEYLQRHLQRLEYLRTSAESSINKNNQRRDQSQPQHVQRLRVGDKVLIKQHPPGRNKIQAKYSSNLHTVVSTPEIGGTYIVKDDATQKERVVTATTRDVVPDDGVRPLTYRRQHGRSPGERTYVVDLSAGPGERYHVRCDLTQPEISSKDDDVADNRGRSRIPMRSRPESPESQPGGVRRVPSRIPVRRSPVKMDQPDVDEAARSDVPPIPRTSPELRRSSRLARKLN
ncbi:Pol polyprotein [Elysia marginata]|uniref:Pol polyprotein n=1 Tax=Elysia marginata TaxID=1093978 RepID=A0AAV4IQE6_9GAST|nr:Pol polyprotein [Elysia marginata]